jgi:4-hydroxybenzoate polyprenyltransferase
LEADRKHPSKKRRPVAAGTVSIQAALPVLVLLVLIAFTTAFMVAPLFAGMVLVHLALTPAYTFLRRKMLVDIRVIGGAAAISVPVSEWLLASPEEVPPDAVVPPDVRPVAVGVVTELPLEEVGCRRKRWCCPMTWCRLWSRWCCPISWRK